MESASISNMADDTTEILCETLDQTVMEKPKYQGIMAFKTVENFVSSSDEAYVPPKFPFELPAFDRSSIPFGMEMRKHFLLDLDNWTFLNHGAFGCVLKDALEVAYKWQCYIERQPLRFVDREMLPLLAHVNRRLAKFVGANPSDIALLPNATAAINTVIRSIDWRPGDTVYYLNTCYYTVKKLFRHIGSEHGKHSKGWGGGGGGWFPPLLSWFPPSLLSTPPLLQGSCRLPPAPLPPPTCTHGRL